MSNDFVLVCACYPQNSNSQSHVRSSPSSAVRHTGILTPLMNLAGFGSDRGEGKTADLLLYLLFRFGPVSSISGSFRANQWQLNIDRSTGPYIVLHQERFVNHIVFSGCSWRVEELPQPANGKVEISTLRPAAKVTYSCDTGFQLTANRVRTCLLPGNWSGETPQCVPQSSPTPSPPTQTSDYSSSATATGKSLWEVCKQP